MKILFLRGIQASGKSTWAKQFIKENQNYKRVCRDDLRHMLSSYKFNKDNERLVTDIENKAIEDILCRRYNLIIDKMNLNKDNYNTDRNLIIKFCELNGLEIPIFEVKEFPITLEEAIERDSKRDFVIGAEVLKNTWKKYSKELNDMIERHERDIKIEYNDSLCDCVIVDIDGTLAIRGNRSPYDFGKVIEDKINQPIADLLHLIKKGYYKPHLFHVIIFSGRDDCCMEDTEKWLQKNDIGYDFVYMRKTGDRRKDSIVKKELFNLHIKNKYNCLYWIDDRRQVIDMVRNELGITCLDCAGHDF
jgi:predicted kinase